MKSIQDTLKIIQDIIRKFPADIDIALIGGYAFLSCMELRGQHLILISAFIPALYALLTIPLIFIIFY